ncbi:MAG: anti-sigma F factor [Bacillota bacterium]
MEYNNEFRVFFKGKSENEALARVMVAGFLSQYDPTLTELQDVKTAVSEAVTNAIIHGYAETVGSVELFCGYCQGILYIEVADKGFGISNIEEAREPLFTSKPEMERSGMGFTIMETFMDYFEVVSTENEGTRIFMEKKIKEE